MAIVPAFLWIKVTRLFLLLYVCISLAACQSEKGNAVEETIDWKSLEFTCVKEKNPPLDKEADHWFKSARAIEKGLKSGTDAQMVELYEMAAARNHYKAISNLANTYAYGDTGSANYDRAIELVEQGMKLQMPDAYYVMGHFIEQGLGVKQDKVAALTYFRKAADLGSPAGLYTVGDKLLGDFRQSPDKDKIMPIGIQMLECSLGQGFAKAGLALGSYFSTRDENKERGLVYFQKAAALGDSQALYMLQAAFAEGKRGVTKDPTRAACYKRLSDELDADKTKKFPDIDRICPLPPKPMP